MSLPGLAPPSNRLQLPLAEHLERLPSSWQEILQAALNTDEIRQLQIFIERRLHAGAVIYPNEPLRALHLTAPYEVSVVLLGQDPYHGPEQAHGLAFSVPNGQRRPPSLRNIFSEVAACISGEPEQFDNDLSRWARQGVLLLNTLLTVEDGTPGAHARRGWETLTDAIITAVAADPKPKVFMLWGTHAQAKQQLINHNSPHLILTANHPSPLSARRPPTPFTGCAHFRKANEWLVQKGRDPIDWAGTSNA